MASEGSDCDDLLIDDTEDLNLSTEEFDDAAEKMLGKPAPVATANTLPTPKTKVGGVSAVEEEIPPPKAAVPFKLGQSFV